MLHQRMCSCGLKMIWIFLIFPQLHVIHSFPTDIAKNVEIIAPSMPDLEFIEPVNLPNLEKGNEKTHKITDSYRAIEPDVAGKSNSSSDQSRQTVITIDHVSPDQRPPYGQPPMPPTEVEVFKPPTKPAAYPPSRPSHFLPSGPGSFHPGRPIPYPPVGPGLYPPNVPLPPDVEVFNPSNVPPPDVEIFNPSDVRPITFPINVADMVPFEKNAIKLDVNDSSVNLYPTLDIPEETTWEATKVYTDYRRLLKFLDSEESAADSRSSKSSLSELENVAGIATTEPPAKSYIASKESHDFVVKIYHNPPKMCYHKISEFDEPEKCITFFTNMTSETTATEEKITDDTENQNIPNQQENPSGQEDESEISTDESEPIEDDPRAKDAYQSTSLPEPTEVNSPAEDVYQSTSPPEPTPPPEPTEVNSPAEDASQSTSYFRDIRFDEATENSLEEDVEVKKLIDDLLVKNIPSEVIAHETDKPDSFEFLETRETTTEKILSPEESTVEDSSSEDALENSENGIEPILQNSTSGQILDTEITKEQITSIISKQMRSTEKFQALCRLLADYFSIKKKIPYTSSESVSYNVDSNQYEMLPVPLPETALVTGRSAGNIEESLLDSVDLVLPEGNINSFDRSVWPNGELNDAHSKLYLVPQQTKKMRSAGSYLSLPEGMMNPYELDGFV